MGEQARGGAGDVGVGVQERLERLHEVGLVLLVVGDQRRDRLGVEALQLGRVLAHRRQQQPVGAGVLERQHRVLVAGLGDVGRQQRLVAGAVEVDRIGGDARVADGEREAVHGARAARARSPSATRRSLGVVGGRQQHDDVAVRRPSITAASEPGAPARAARSAAASTRRAPVVVGGRVVVRRGRRPRAPPAARSIPELGGARDDVAAVGHLAVQHGAQEARPARPRTPARARARARPRTRSASSTIRRSAGRGSPERPRTRRRPTTTSPTRSSCVTTPSASRHQRALVRGRARGDGEHGARAVDQHQRGVERPRRGANDLGQAEAGLDRVGDLRQRVEVVRRRRFPPDRDRLGHRATAGRSTRAPRRPPALPPGRRRRGRTRSSRAPARVRAAASRNATPERRRRRSRATSETAMTTPITITETWSSRISFIDLGHHCGARARRRGRVCPPATTRRRPARRLRARR